MRNEDYIKIRNKLLEILCELLKSKGSEVIGVDTEFLDKWSLELAKEIESLNS